MAGIKVIPPLLSDWFRKEHMTQLRPMRHEEQLTGVSEMALVYSSERASGKDVLVPLHIVIHRLRSGTETAVVRPA